MSDDRFDVYSTRGKRVYLGMRKCRIGLDWGDGFGFLTHDQVRKERFTLKLVTSKESKP